jgi:tetratricopeptide (TPR) repeat protein
MKDRRVGIRAALAALLLLGSQSVAHGEQTGFQNKNAAGALESEPSVSAETRGDLLMMRHQYMQALGEYAKVPKTSAEIWNKMGVAYHHMFAIEEAKRDYTRALSLKPDMADALSNLGSIYFNLKDYRRAEKYYRRALKVRPVSAVVYHNLGMLYFVRGKVSQGAQALRRALQIDPTALERDTDQSIAEPLTQQDRARESYCLAQLLAEQGQYDRALEYLHKAFDEGFNDRKRLAGDPAFSAMRGSTVFAQLVAEKPR